MALPSGLSELDTVVLRLPGSGREITNWTRYSYNQAFLTPTAGWSFSVPADDRALVDELLVVGAPVELAMNDRLQCSGFIDKRTIDAGSSGGTVVTVQGRDILGRVVDSCIDPAYKFASGSTLADVVLSVLAQFGIDTIYNSDAINVNAVTGLPLSLIHI
jgi:prophage tail gpP-like protein